MKLASILNAVAAAAVYFCAASMLAQAVGVGILWSRGALDWD